MEGALLLKALLSRVHYREVRVAARHVVEGRGFHAVEELVMVYQRNRLRGRRIVGLYLIGRALHRGC